MNTKGYQISWWLIFLEFSMLFGISLLGDYIIEVTSLSKSTLEIMSQFLILLPIIIGIIVIKKYYPKEAIKTALGFSGFDITMLLFFIIMPFSAQTFIQVITMPATVVLSQIFGEYTPVISAPESLYEFFYSLTTACIIAPVLEEILFRGVLMKLLSPYGFLTAALVSSLGFSILHASPQGFLIILFIGFVLALIRYISGSVFACMVFHAFSNFYSLLTLIFEEQIMIMEKEFVVFTLFSGLLFPIIFLLYKKLYPKAETYVVTAKKQGFSFGLLFCIMIFIIYSVLLSKNI